MNPKQKELIKQVYLGLKIVPFPSKGTLTSTSLNRLMQVHDLNNARLGLGEMIGFTSDAIRHLDSLAHLFRSSHHGRTQVVKNATLIEVIKNEMIDRWHDRPADTPSESEIEELWQAIEKWFSSHSLTRTHYVPCILSPHAVSRFCLGPVLFYPLSGLETGLEGQEIVRGRFIELAKQRDANWIAEITVSGREEKQSTVIADLITDVALGALQVAFGNENFHGISRATARMSPTFRCDMLQKPDGSVSFGMRNHLPGLTISGSTFRDYLLQTEALCLAMGDRLHSYVEGGGSTPALNEAWCNAVYWYHEALADPLETVAIAKLETAIEVLFRSENLAQGKDYIRRGMEVFFNMPSDHMLQGPATSVKKFVESIVTARSRILHGTWHTIQPDLPRTGEAKVTFETVEPLVRGFLAETAAALSRYANADRVIDDTNSFLDWCKANPSVTDKGI